MELTRGLRCLAEGDVTAAEGHFERAHTSGPDRPEVCFALGRERLRQGRTAEAETLLRTAWRGGMLAAAAALARCLGTLPGRRADALAILDEACAGGDEEPGLLVVRAELHIAAAEAEQARRAIDRARAVLDGEERDAPATRAATLAAEARILNLEGIGLAGEGRADEALFAFKRAFDLEPTWAGPLVNMGAVFARLGRPARARACYDRALVLEPENPVARFNLAELARQRGDVMTAEAEYQKVLELAPEYPGARIALAALLWDSAQREPALEVLRSGNSVVDAENLVAACRLAGALAAAGQYEEAARLVRAARAANATRADEILGR